MSALLLATNTFCASASLALEVGDYAVVDANVLNVRVGPGTTYSKRGKISRKLGVKVISMDGAWAEIQTSTQSHVPLSQVVYHDEESGWNVVTGWVKSEYLREAGADEAYRVERDAGDWIMQETLLSDRFSSALGQVYISKRATTVKLWVGEKSVNLDGYMSASMEQAKDNWFILSLFTGGSACPALFQILDTEDTEFALSKTFGSCADGYSLVAEGDFIEVRTSGYTGEGDIAYVYDGNKVSKKSLGLTDRDAVSNPYDPMAWVGNSAFEYLVAPQNEGFLLEMMSWKELNSLRHSVKAHIADFAQDGEWIVSSGCTPSMCNQSGGLVAISVETGVPFFAYRKWNDDEWTFLGETPNVLPPSVRQVLFSY